MQDDVQPPRQPQPEGVQTSSTYTDTPNNPSNPADNAAPRAPAPVEPVTPEKKKGSAAKWIVIALLALIIGGLVGYMVGGAMKESEIESQYSTEISDLESQLKASKATIQKSLTDAKSTITQSKEELKATIDEQNAKIADLQKQIDEAKQADSTTPPETTN